MRLVETKSLLNKFIFVPVAALALTVTLCSCGRSATKSAREMEKNVKSVEPFFDKTAVAEESTKSERSSGSLWVDSYNSNLYSNMYRASKVGDSVTVVISEEAAGKRETKTDTKRKSENTASIDALGTVMSTLSRIFTNLNPAKLIAAKTDEKFEGKGKIDSTGSLYASLTCRVMQRLPNGDMLIRGEKRVKVSKEEQILILEGIIRPYDILPDNTISSKYVADARISYTGFGVVAERQSPGWLARVLDYVWPF